jgi:hypothetical protein
MIMYFLHKIEYKIIKKRNQTTALLVITFWIIIYFLASRTSTEENDSERIKFLNYSYLDFTTFMISLSNFKPQRSIYFSTIINFSITLSSTKLLI